MSQSHLTIDFPIKGPANAKALTEELPPLMPDFAKAQDDLGTVALLPFHDQGRREASLHFGHRRRGRCACRAARGECRLGV